MTAGPDHPGLDRRGEVRLAPALATLLAVALYAALPDDLIVGPRLVVPTVEVLLLLPS